MKAKNYASMALKSNETPKYVKLQCQKFLDISNNKNETYFIDEKKVNLLENALKMMFMPKGLKAGQSLFNCTCGYQWLFFTSVLCIVRRDNPQKRKYETAILEIGRKNFKTFTIATIFILLLLLEPQFSKFYSVAPDGARSRLVKDAIEEILKSSPKVYRNSNGNLFFKITRDLIKFSLNENTYYPLNYSNSSMDGRMPNVFLADEIGDLPNSYAIEAMKSGQLNILNKLGCMISTKYPTIENPLETQVNYAKSVLDGETEDETLFALLYEPDDCSNWMNDDLILKQANPVSHENPEIWEDLIKKRNYAISVETARENFLTKHCNIIYQGAASESFVDIAEVQKCRADKIEWRGKEVYIGVDLSMSSDNTAVSMAALDENNNILCDSWCFIPEGRLEMKSRLEKLDYKLLCGHKNPKCFVCGNQTVDYEFVENFVLEIEQKYGCLVRSIGFDRYNAMSSAQKWAKVYKTVEIRQHSDTLHAPTKLLTEKIQNGEFKFEPNPLLEQNFANARCVYDTNMNRYVNKRKSNGKIDMIAALINAVFLLQKDVLFGVDVYAV
jgi:phage terminase large subunit-like protein